MNLNWLQQQKKKDNILINIILIKKVISANINKT